MKTLITSLLVLIISFSISTAYNNSQNPVQLSTAQDIEDLMGTPADWGLNFILMNDIDITGITTAPIGNFFTFFTGSFNGQGFTISNFSINVSSDYVGFFGFLFQSTIQNLGLINVDVTGNSFVGGFLGYSYDSDISNCYSTGDVVGSGSNIGGFCGINDFYSVITNCYSTGNIDCNGNYYYVGGFCGQNSNYSVITNCYSTGNVESDDSFVGGFCGLNSASQISNSYSTCSVISSAYNAGGFCGENIFNALINTCYSTGAVSCDYYGGGFCGLNDGSSSISYCYSIGTVTITGDYRGGFLGQNYSGGVAICCFWNITTTGITDAVGVGDDSGITGLTDQQFSDPSNFSCFDFGKDWIMPSSLRYGDKFGNYPILRSILFTFFIPTLTEWAIIIFICLLAGVGGWFVWRRFV